MVWRIRFGLHSEFVFARQFARRGGRFGRSVCKPASKPNARRHRVSLSGYGCDVGAFGRGRRFGRICYMSLLFSVFVLISFLFFILLAIKEMLGLKFCVLCASVSAAWLGL